MSDKWNAKRIADAPDGSPRWGRLIAEIHSTELEETGVKQSQIVLCIDAKHSQLMVMIPDAATELRMKSNENGAIAIYAVGSSEDALSDDSTAAVSVPLVIDESYDGG